MQWICGTTEQLPASQSELCSSVRMLFERNAPTRYGTNVVAYFTSTSRHSQNCLDNSALAGASNRNTVHMPIQRTVVLAAWILHGVRGRRWILTWQCMLTLAVNAHLDSECGPWQCMLTLTVNVDPDSACSPWQWMLTLTVNADPDSECSPWQWMFTLAVNADLDSEC